MKIIIILLLGIIFSESSFLNDSFSNNHTNETIENDNKKNSNFNNTLLASSKLTNIQNRSLGKKKQYSDFVIQNEHESSLTEYISDDLTKFEAYSKLLSKLMHTIIDKDLGVGAIQKALEGVNVSTFETKFIDILDELTDNIYKKLDDIHTIIETTGERVQEIFKQQYSSNITTAFISCCDLYAKEFNNYYNQFSSTLSNLHENSPKTSSINGPNLKPEIKYNYDAHFNSQISLEHSCDIGDAFRPHFFTPSGPNLTEQFRDNLQQTSTQIKWQYFISFHGIHTEFPAYLPPINYCLMHNIEHAHMVGDKIQYDTVGTTFGKHFQRRYRSKVTSKKSEFLQQHLKAYNDLNQLFLQRHRENLLSSALPSHKLVVIVIDRGSAITDHQMNIAKTVGKYILNSLSHRDRVALVDLTSNVIYPSADVCSSKFEIAFANYETKHVLGRFIDDMQKSHNSTNHLLGFKRAFEIINHNFQHFNEIGKEPDIFIPYISRGLLASLTDAKPVMELIANELKNQTYSFVINCYAPIDSTKPIMFETTFLKELSSMNFRKFNVDPPPLNRIRSGLMVELNNADNLGFTLNGVYNVLKKPKQDDTRHLYVSLPNYDFISKDVHVSISKPFFYRDMFLGIVGVDVPFFELASSVFNHAHQPWSYAFLMESYSGRILYHPQLLSKKHTEKVQNKHIFRSEFAFSASSFVNENVNVNNANLDLLNTFINAEHIEQSINFLSVKKKIMNQEFGSSTIELSYPSSFDSNTLKNESFFTFWNDRQFILENFKTITYYWKRIIGTSYIVVLTEYGNGSEINFKSRMDFAFKKKYDYQLFVHHRLDFSSLLHGDSLRLCKYFNQLSTLDTSALYLTSTAFERRLNDRKGQIGVIEDLMFYLGNQQNNNNKHTDPNLKVDIHRDVNFMSQMTVLWKKLLHTSDNSKYIVRKYIMSVSGAFLIYPGTMLDQAYEPTTRPWYTRAMNTPNKLIFLPPYLDVGGSGYIITLSQAIKIRNTSVWAVMGIDLTFGYFHKIINEIVPFCKNDKSSCFLMDDFGYLIVHSSFLKPITPINYERIHITHKEPQMVNDLLNQKHFVKKLVCNSYHDRTIQRSYMFNTSLVGIMTNIIQTEDRACAKYKLVTLESTNAFFGIVNHSCDNSITFCPCSMTDRLCLNCHRMEQTDCECPCECPLIMNMCSGELVEHEDRNPACNLIPDITPKEINPPKYLLEPLETCIHSECFHKQSESDCKGLLGCEWCTMDSETLLKKPFCSKQNLCFGGVYGSKNPYSNQNYHFHHREFKPLQDSPIGPWTITVIVCCVILIFSIYCFHSNASRGLTQRYLNPHHPHDHSILPGNELPEPEIEFLPQNEQLEAVPAVPIYHAVDVDLPSPYQVNSNYRRPRVESDYGYSTMSPNGNSEPNQSVYVEEHISEVARNKVTIKNREHYNSSETFSSGDDNLSIFSHPSTSSSVKTSFPLPPPPSSSRPGRKVRSKQRYCSSIETKKLKTLDESVPEIV